jgi:hypothetical protein
MAKKKRRTGPATVDGGNANDDVPDGKDSDASQLDLELVVRAVHWLASLCKVGVGLVLPSAASEALLEALQPIIQARANKYEEDAKDAKATNGAIAKGLAQGVVGNKRQYAFVSNSSSFCDSFHERDVAPATTAINALATNVDSLMSKECKPLRAALHPLVEAHLREAKASPAFRITSMLGQRNRRALALPLLAELRSAPPQRRPKLGAYMRWVRELNAADGTPEELALLDAIMRTAAGSPLAKSASPMEGSLKTLPAFDCSSMAANEDKSSSSASKAPPSYSAGAYTVLAHESAHERKPPNHFDLDIYACAPGVIALSAPAAREAARHPVPGVPGAFVLSNVLSISETASIRNLSEAIGYRPDVPLSSSLDERSQNVVLLASDADNDALFARVKEFLPPELEGDRLLGLNRRWRLYRYHAGNVYRKHIDGAWPASGTKRSPSGGQEYVYDALGGSAWSRLTFVLYLSEGFEGGETSFFVPNAEIEGVLEAHPVRPREGFATVFVHGDTGVPLLHEGSPVISGTKYILRTDVIYQSDESTEMRRAAARLRGLARQVGVADPTAAGEAVESETVEVKKNLGKASKKSKKTQGKKSQVIKDKLKSGTFSKKNRKRAGGKRAGTPADA